MVFLARFVIQNGIYNAGETTALGITRILMGWPLTGIVTILTVWMVRRANAAVEESQGVEGTQSSEDTKERIHD